MKKIFLTTAALLTLISGSALAEIKTGVDNCSARVVKGNDGLFVCNVTISYKCPVRFGERPRDGGTTFELPIYFQEQLGLAEQECAALSSHYCNASNVPRVCYRPVLDPALSPGIGRGRIAFFPDDVL